MKLRIALMALATTALIGLAACGGDDDSDEPSAGETTTEATTTTEAGGGGGGGGGGEGGTVSLAADPGGGLAYDTDSLSVPAGEVTIEFTNDSSLGHDVQIEDSSGENVGGTAVISESEETASVELEAGDYTFYCSVPGHREGGMEGTLTAE